VVLRRRWRRLPVEDVRAGRYTPRKPVPSVQASVPAGRRHGPGRRAGTNDIFVPTMPKHLFLLLLFCGCSLLAFNVKGDITQLNSSIESAISTRDIAAIAPLLTDDFQFILRRGNLIDKKGYLDSLKAGGMLADVHGEITKMRVYGDTVVLTVKSSSPTAKEEWYTTRLFVRQAGAWKMALQQATLVSR